jgi:hypothetical protein
MAWTTGESWFDFPMVRETLSPPDGSRPALKPAPSSIQLLVLSLQVKQAWHEDYCLSVGTAEVNNWRSSYTSLYAAVWFVAELCAGPHLIPLPAKFRGRASESDSIRFSRNISHFLSFGEIFPAYVPLKMTSEVRWKYTAVLRNNKSPYQ